MNFNFMLSLKVCKVSAPTFFSRHLHLSFKSTNAYQYAVAGWVNDTKIWHLETKNIYVITGHVSNYSRLYQCAAFHLRGQSFPKPFGIEQNSISGFLWRQLSYPTAKHIPGILTFCGQLYYRNFRTIKRT